MHPETNPHADLMSDELADPPVRHEAFSAWRWSRTATPALEGPTGTAPSIQRVVVRDLTEETDGNAVAIGMADVVLRLDPAQLRRGRC